MQASQRGTKHGVLLGVVSLLFVLLAIDTQFWFFFCPAVSFGIVAFGYLQAGPKVFGKSSRGTISFFNILLLLPYLAYAWSTWHLLRFVKRENAYDQLTNNIFIGRRLTRQECPDYFEHVIDLTCEFNEPEKLRSRSYYSFQVLDGFVPTCDQLCDWVEAASKLQGNLYIHCAEGHGRTGLFAAALLLYRGDFQTVESALQFIQSKRPLVRLGSLQFKTLSAAQQQWENVHSGDEVNV